MRDKDKYRLLLNQFIIKPKLSKVFPLIFAPEYFFFSVFVIHCKMKRKKVVCFEAPLFVSSHNHRNTHRHGNVAMDIKFKLPVEFVMYSYTCMSKIPFYQLVSPWSRVGGINFKKLHQEFFPCFQGLDWDVIDGSRLKQNEKLKVFMTISFSAFLKRKMIGKSFNFKGTNRFSSFSLLVEN